MADINFEEQIKMLIELQQLDTEIYSRKRVLNVVPERMKELDATLNEKSTNMKNLEEESKAVQVQRKEKEVDLQTKEQTIKKYQTQLFQVKTNKEYSSLEKEIANIKADNSLLEEEILILFDKTDEIQKKVAAEKQILENEKKKIADEKKKIEDERKAAEAEINDLVAKRTAFTEKIEKRILSQYERILENRDGSAMVPVVGDACGGCNMNLPPQVINEAKLKKHLTFCGNCARILYSD